MKFTKEKATLLYVLLAQIKDEAYKYDDYYFVEVRRVKSAIDSYLDRSTAHAKSELFGRVGAFIAGRKPYLDKYSELWKKNALKMQEICEG